MKSIIKTEILVVCLICYLVVTFCCHLAEINWENANSSTGLFLNLCTEPLCFPTETVFFFGKVSRPAHTSLS